MHTDNEARLNPGFLILTLISGHMLCVVQSWVGPSLLTQNSEKAPKGGLDGGWMDRQTNQPSVACPGASCVGSQVV